MKKISIFILLLAGADVCCHAQAPEFIHQRCRKVLQLIREDNARELSKYVAFPLVRRNPLPDITTPRSFVSYYPMLFDSAFKRKIGRYNDSDLFSHDGYYLLAGGPFNGDLALGDGGKIIAVNYTSRQEAALKARLAREIKSRVHPSVNSWIQNVVMARSQHLLIRVDQTDKGLRYAAWVHGHPVSAKPDLVLYNGTEIEEGTMGGFKWIFKKGDWTYVVDEVDVCGAQDECGLFLRLLFKQKQKESITLTIIKPVTYVDGAFHVLE